MIHPKLEPEHSYDRTVRSASFLLHFSPENCAGKTGKTKPGATAEKRGKGERGENEKEVNAYDQVM